MQQAGPPQATTNPRAAPVLQGMAGSPMHECSQVPPVHQPPALGEQLPVHPTLGITAPAGGSPATPPGPPGQRLGALAPLLHYI